MKKSKLKQKTPLKRLTPLKQKAFSQLNRGCIKSSHAIKRTKRIKQVSDRRKKEGAEYSKLRRAFLLAHPRCQVCLGIRTSIQPSTEVHHKASRGRFYLATGTWLAVCHVHHEQITANRKWAEYCGFTLTTEEIRKLS